MRKVVHKAETVASEWHKMTPHLPASGQKWLADNVWWIAGVLGILALIGVILTIGTFIRAISPVSSYGFELTASYTGGLVASSLINMLVLAVVAGLLLMAVKPLQTLEKKGWVLVFMSTLAGAGLIVINALISLIGLDIASFVTTLLIGAIFVALEAYFLFEIRDKFGHAHKAAPKE